MKSNEAGAITVHHYPEQLTTFVNILIALRRRVLWNKEKKKTILIVSAYSPAMSWTIRTRTFDGILNRTEVNPSMEDLTGEVLAAQEIELRQLCGGGNSGYTGGQ